MTVPRHFALIPAAGVGSRMGSEQPKQYLSVAGKPMLAHVLDTFCAASRITHTFVVASQGDPHIESLCGSYPPERLTVLFAGGPTRQASVLNGLTAMRDQVAGDDWVLVHDAARPGLTNGLIGQLIDALGDDPIGGLLALPVVDTLKRADAQGRVGATVPREALWAAQTPQMFRYALLRSALEQAQQVTDEASAIEALGLHPKLVEGSARNFKVTLPADVALAELHLATTNPPKGQA